MTTDQNQKSAYALTESNTFCMAPWVHLYIATDQSVRLCCEADWRESLGNLSNSSLQNIWNNEQIREIRNQMLAGKKVKACMRCYELERLGAPSYRQYFNNEWKDNFADRVENSSSGAVESRDICFLDLRLSNKCNNKCRICCPSLSSMWNQDANFIDDELYSRAPSAKEFDLKALNPSLKSSQMIHFGGGEPLIMDEHYHVLLYLIQNNRLNTLLRYNTNLSTLCYKSYDVIELWKKFDNVRIELSLDGSHHRGEYMRSGSSWRRIVSNIHTIKEKCPHIQIQVNCTISIMNIFHALEFYQELLAENLITRSNFAPYPLFNPEWLSIQSLPKSIKEDCTKKYEKFLSSNLVDLNDLTERFQSIISFMNSDNKNKWNDFLRITKRLDYIRGENFLSTFPEFEDYL